MRGISRKYRFYKNELGWFIDLKWFPFSKGYLAMVLGADILLDELSDNTSEVYLRISSFKINDYTDVIVKKRTLSFLGGAVYKTLLTKLPNIGFGKNKLWLCFITLLIFGRYPNKIYFKTIK